MKTQEFIKQYGWSKFVVIVFESIGHGANTFYDTHDELYYGQINDIRVSVADLKQLVDAWELVNKYGGLSEAKAVEQQYWNSGVGAAMIVAMELQQAIELVESVNENN